jgi:NADH dehydrogenase FAD-containing subunit
MTTDSVSSLAALEARLAQDLGYLGWPARQWMPARQADGEPVLDVAIVGGGMAGLALGASLTHLGMQAPSCSTALPPASKARGPPPPAWRPCARPRS